MRNIKGSNLVEYSIGGAVVALVVGFSLYSMLSDGKIAQLMQNSLNMKIEGDKGVVKMGSFVEGADSSQVDSPFPVLQGCTSDSCSIDFGDFTLSGVPANFNNLVETSGIAGGTDAVAGLLEQIAQSYEDQGLTEQSDKITKLANLAHSMARIQENFDAKVSACGTSPNCLYWALATNNDQLDLDTSALGYSINTVYGQDSSKLWPTPDWDYVNSQIAVSYDLIDSASLGIAMNSYNTDPAGFQSKIQNNPNIGYQFVNLYQELQKDPAVGATTKAVMEELAWDMDKMGSRFTVDVDYMMAACLGDSNPGSGKKRYNFKGDPEDATFSGDVVNDFTNYKADEVTDFDAGLMCAAGKGKDKNKKCH